VWDLPNPYILDKYILSTWIKKKDTILYYKQMFLRNLNNCTSIPFEVDNSSIKQGDDRVRPTMNMLTAAKVMKDKSNHRILVKEINLGQAALPLQGRMMLFLSIAGQESHRSGRVGEMKEN
jgi:hypothetical protein